MAIGFVLVWTSVLLLLSSASPPRDCTDQLIAFSPCLTYISLWPNNLTDTAPAQCCESFVVDYGGNCFCYLVKQPLLFAFPLNQSRLLSLPSACSRQNASLAIDLTVSLDSLCSALPALPPLHGATDSEISVPDKSGINDVQSPMINLPPESMFRSPKLPDPPESMPLRQPIPLLTPPRHSSSAKHININNSCILPVGIIIDILVLISFP